MKNVVAVALACLLFPVSATAQDWTGFYGGVSVGAGGGDLDVLPPPDPYDLEGTAFGAFAGYNRQFGSLVLGGEFALTTSDIALDCCSGQKYERIYDLKARVGYATGAVLAYGIVGYSMNDFTSPGGDSSGDGANFGLGLDYRMTENLLLGAEFLQRNMRNSSETGVSGLDASMQTLSLRLGWAF